MAHNIPISFKIYSGDQLVRTESLTQDIIKVGKLRGVESQGMLCSARELKLSEDHGGLLELDADTLAKHLRILLRVDAQNR